MTSIHLKDVAVEYPIPHFRNRSLVGAVKNAAIGGLIGRSKIPTVRALNGVTMSLKEGDRLGLLGRNGAGKTTLLKVMAGILPPTKGSVRVEGRISPLVSIQLGLDGEATGYENIRIRGRFMGQSDEQIAKALPEIAQFTELESYLHLPLKTYSSGMRTRLAFATATAFEPEVLIMDEWLGAGDREFRDKATRRLRGLIERAGLFVFASHSRDWHERICNKGAIIDKGQLVFFGDIEEAFAVLDAEPKQPRKQGDNEPEELYPDFAVEK